MTDGFSYTEMGHLKPIKFWHMTSHFEDLRALSTPLVSLSSLTWNSDKKIASLFYLLSCLKQICKSLCLFFFNPTVKPPQKPESSTPLVLCVSRQLKFPLTNQHSPGVDSFTFSCWWKNTKSPFRTRPPEPHFLSGHRSLSTTEN